MLHAHPPCLPARSTDRLPADVTFVSVGHRPTLTLFHDSVLLLHGSGRGIEGGTPGGWEVRPAAEMSVEAAMDYIG